MESNNENKNRKGNPIVGLIVIFVVIVLFFKMCSSGYRCTNCGGDGKITVFGVTEQCPMCHGDGKVSKKDQQEWNSR